MSGYKFKMRCFFPKFLSLALIIFFLFPNTALSKCTNSGSIEQEYFNRTDKPLVLSLYMHWQTYDIKNDESIMLPPGGSKKFSSCAGGMDYSVSPIELRSRAYDFGVSVGPFNFISHQGSWPNWETGLNRNYSKYIINTLQWYDRKDTNWTIYAPGGNQSYSAVNVNWNDRDNCTGNLYVGYDICYAVELNTCNAEGSCDTYANFYINALGRALPTTPLGKY